MAHEAEDAELRNALGPSDLAAETNSGPDELEAASPSFFPARLVAISGSVLALVILKKITGG